MAKYDSFNAGKYHELFDQMYGKGTRERAINSSRETGRLKVEASLARKEYEARRKAEEAARKKEAKEREKAKAAAPPKADEGYSRTRAKKSSDDGILGKLADGVKSFTEGANRIQARAINTLTAGHFSNKSKAEEKKTGKPKYDYFDERTGGGKVVDVLSDMSGYALGGIGATAGLRALGATGKGINALSQANKAGKITKPLLKRAAIDSAKEGAIVGGGLAGLESLTRAGYGNSEGLGSELKHIALGTALGGALDPLITAGMPALKMASRGAVDDLVRGQGADALRRAASKPLSPADVGTQQLNDMLLGTRSQPETMMDRILRGQEAQRGMDITASPQAQDARSIMQDISETAGRKPRGVDAEENLMNLVRNRRDMMDMSTPARVQEPSAEMDNLAEELKLFQQERLAYEKLDKSDPQVQREIRDLEAAIKATEDDLASYQTNRTAPTPIEPSFNRSDSVIEPEVAATSSRTPLEEAMRRVEGTSPVRPPQSPPEADINRSFIDRTVKKPKVDSRTALTKAQQQFTNDTAPLRQIDQQMKSLDSEGMLQYLNPKTMIKSRSKQLATKSSLEKSALNAKGAHSVAANHVTGRFAPFLENLNKSKTTNMAELGDYAFARHGMSLLDNAAEKQMMRDSLLEEVDALKASLGADSDEVRAMQEVIDNYTSYTMPEGATADVLQAQIAKFEQNPELVAKYDEFVALQQQNLKDMREGGMITDDLYKKLEKNATYISMHRNFDEVSSAAGMSSRRPQNTLERMAQGSEAKVKEPIQEAIRNAYLTRFNIEKNNALKVVETFAAIDKDAVLFRPSIKPNSKTISIFKNGKPKHYEVPPELKAYVDNFGADRDPDILTNVFQKAAQMQRKLTTQYNLAFQLKSLVREPVQAMLTSRTAPTAIHAAKNTALGYVDALVGPQLQNVTKRLPKHLQFNSYKANWDEMGGTGFQFIRMSDDDLQRVAKEMLQEGTAKGSIRKLNPFRSLGKFGEKVEEGARLGEFRSAKNQGYADADAFYEATDITNYKRSGEFTRAANKYVPFLNATIQGNSRVMRAFQEAPERTILRGATMLSTAAIGAYSMRFHDDVSDAQRQELDNLSQWEKDSYMHIPVPNSETIIAIPKAFAVGQMFMNPVERALDDYYNAVMKEESVPKQVKEGIKSTLKSFIPPYEVAGLTTLYELKQNKSLFSNQEIESQFDRDAGVPKEHIEAYNQSWLTGVVSDWINKMSFDSDSEGIVSPAQVDYFIKDLTGTTGAQTLGIMDSLVSDNAPTKTTGDQLLKPIKQFEADPTRASGVYAELQKLAKKEKRDNQSMTGMTEDEKNAERERRPLQNYEAAFKDINKEIQAVRSSKEMTSQEKRDAITELRKSQDSLGTQAIDWYNSFN